MFDRFRILVRCSLFVVGCYLSLVVFVVVCYLLVVVVVSFVVASCLRLAFACSLLLVPRFVCGRLLLWLFVNCRVSFVVCALFVAVCRCVLTYVVDCCCS